MCAWPKRSGVRAIFTKYGLVEYEHDRPHPSPISRPRRNQLLSSRLRAAGRHGILKIVKRGRKSDGQIGEIIVKAPYVMNRYLNQPELTAEALKDGWLYTGDMGRVDEEGYVYIVDRKRDMVISGGMNVFPAEVEEVIRRNAKVKEVSVIGIPDSYWGEAVTACVVPGEVTEDGRVCKGKAAKYAQPRRRVWDALPKTILARSTEELGNPSGKAKTRRV